MLLAAGLAFAAAPSDSFRDKLNLSKDPEVVLAEILARDEFKESALDSLIDRIREGLADAWRKMVKWLSKSMPEWEPTGLRGEWFLWALGILAAAALVVVLAIILAWLIESVTGREKRLEREKSVDDLLSESPSDLKPQALRMAEQGDFRKALMLLFRFVLLRLGDTERIHWHPCWTNREILRRVAKEEPVRETLEQMVSLFNGICYGSDQCGRPEFDKFLALAERATGRS